MKFFNKMKEFFGVAPERDPKPLNPTDIKHFVEQLGHAPDNSKTIMSPADRQKTEVAKRRKHAINEEVDAIRRARLHREAQERRDNDNNALAATVIATSYYNDSSSDISSRSCNDYNSSSSSSSNDSSSSCSSSSSD